MKNDLSQDWLERHNDEHKIRRDDHRSPFQRDRARILHSAAFRRLQAKTQVHSNSFDDFHRTRLTHSLEVAQLGSGIVAQIKQKQPEFTDILPSNNLIESACLAHDIGHPPFGHGGEVALNYLMRDHGGFEGNAQTFRIVTKLEPYTEHYGMNLSRRTLLGLIKYPQLLSQLARMPQPEISVNPHQLKTKLWLPAKGLYDCDNQMFNWVIAPLSENDQTLLKTVQYNPEHQHAKTQFKSIDCSIMELADDIAYGIHDLEDAIALKMISLNQWQDNAVAQLVNCGDEWFAEHIYKLTDMLFSDTHYQRKDAIGGIVNALLTSISIQEVAVPFTNPLLRWNAYMPASMAKALNVFKSFVSQYVIQIPQVQIAEFRGQKIIIDIFEALTTEPERLLPISTQETWHKATSESDKMRVITDYISSMTDGHAQKLHRQLFSSLMW